MEKGSTSSRRIAWLGLANGSLQRRANRRRPPPPPGQLRGARPANFSSLPACPPARRSPLLDGCCRCRRRRRRCCSCCAAAAARLQHAHPWPDALTDKHTCLLTHIRTRTYTDGLQPQETPSAASEPASRPYYTDSNPYSNGGAGGHGTPRGRPISRASKIAPRASPALKPSAATSPYVPTTPLWPHACSPSARTPARPLARTQADADGPQQRSARPPLLPFFSFSSLIHTAAHRRHMLQTRSCACSPSPSPSCSLLMPIAPLSASTWAA